MNINKVYLSLYLIGNLFMSINAGNIFSWLSSSLALDDILTKDLAKSSLSFISLSANKQLTVKKELINYYLAKQRTVFKGKMLHFAGGVYAFCDWSDGNCNMYHCTLAPDAALSFLITSVITGSPHAWLSDLRREPYKHYCFSPENLPINCMATLINSGLMLTSACQNPSYNPQVILWNFTTQEKEFTFESHNNTITSLLFSPDGLMGFSGSLDQKIFKYDLSNYNKICLIDDVGAPITCMAISPDGTKLFTGSTDNIVRIWHADTGIFFENQFDCDFNNQPNHQITTLTMSPNGQFIFISSTNGYSALWFFNQEAGEGIIQLGPYVGYPNSATISSDSNNVLVSYANAPFQMPRCYTLATESSITLFGPEKLVGIEHNFIALKFNADRTAIYGLYENGYMVKWEFTEDRQQVEAQLMNYTFDQLLFLLQSDNDPKAVNAKITAGEIYFSVLNSFLPKD